MAEKDCPGGKSRWDSAKESTLAIANKVAEWDKDGITVVPFAGSHKVYENVDAAKVNDIFKENEPMGGTTLGPVLKTVFTSYQQRKKAGTTKPNGELLIIVTDGSPSDEVEVAKQIVAFGNSLENADQEYGIQFLQVGKDQSAASFLKKLDDDLTKQGAKNDIVDTKTMEELENVGLTEALIAALND